MSGSGPATEQAKAQAEARFQRRREQDAMAQAGVAAEKARVLAEQEKTARLRALRLAKEEEDRAVAAARPPVTKKSAAPRARSSR